MRAAIDGRLVEEVFCKIPFSLPKILMNSVGREYILHFSYGNPPRMDHGTYLLLGGLVGHG